MVRDSMSRNVELLVLDNVIWPVIKYSYLPIKGQHIFTIIGGGEVAIDVEEFTIKKNKNAYIVRRRALSGS